VLPSNKVEPVASPINDIFLALLSWLALSIKPVLRGRWFNSTHKLGISDKLTLRSDKLILRFPLSVAFILLIDLTIFFVSHVNLPSLLPQSDIVYI
jgi:hypothetical protein